MMRGRAVGYVRVGKRDEDLHQNLAGRQIDTIAEWAAENEADVFEWFFDLGVDESEPLDQRSAGAALLKRIRRGDISHLVVTTLDVLGKGRMLRDAVQLLFQAKDRLRIATVLPGPHEAAEPIRADEVGKIRANGSMDRKAA